MAYHNMHTHIFTMKNSPENFLHLYMPGFAAEAVDKITSTKAGAGAIEWLLNKIGGKGGKKYASFLHVGKSASQLDVFRDLLDQYEDSSMKITALTLNMEKLGAGKSISGFEGQLEEIVTVKRRYPDRLLIFLSVDPRWKETAAEIVSRVKAYFDTRVQINATRPSVSAFAGIKLYPSTGFYVFDEKLKPTFEWAAENEVPILTHCNYLGGIFNNDRKFLDIILRHRNPYTGSYHEAPAKHHKLQSKFMKRVMGTQSAINNQYYSSYFLEPCSYRDKLKYFRDDFKKPLKICMAHFGGNHHMKLQHELSKDPAKGDPGNYYGVLPGNNWTRQIQDLMTEFDSVYTDISYALTDEKTHEFIFSEMNNPAYNERILFGTDFFMTEREEQERNTYNKFKKAALLHVVKKKDGTETTAWDMMAGENVERFLKSRYY